MFLPPKVRTAPAVGRAAAGLLLSVALSYPIQGRAAADAAIDRDLNGLKSDKPEIVSDSIQSLGNMAGQSTPEVRRELQSRAGNLLVSALRDSDQEIRLVAAFALGNIFGGGLGTLASNEDRPPDATHHMPSESAAPIDKAGVLQALAATLGDKETMVRAKAAQAIGAFGSSAAPQVPALILALEEPETSVREAAAGSLGRLQLLPELSVPALASRLASSVGSDAPFEDALSAFGPKAAPAMPTLLAMLKSSQSAPLYSAAKVLQSMGPAMQPAIPDLLVALHDEHPETSTEVAEALALSGTFHQEALRAAIRDLHSESEDDRIRSAYVVGTFGAGAASALDPLGHALRDPEPSVHPFAARAIGTIAKALRQSGRKDGLDPLQDLLKTIRESDDPVAQRAADDVGEAVDALKSGP